MTVVSYDNLRTRALQVLNERAGFANDETRIGTLFRDMIDSLGSAGVLNVQSYGASASNTGAANDAAIATAITAAIAAGSSLYWPSGNYTSAASISNLHSVRHRGPGFIKRGTDYFAVENTVASNNTNRLYVATAGGGGSATNDGLSASQPMLTPGGAFTALKNYGPKLDGSWRVVLAAGTYSINSQTFEVASRDWVIVQGPDVGGHPNVPTAILDGTGVASNQHGFVIGTGGSPAGIAVWFQDIKVQNYAAGSNNCCGWSQGYGARCIYVNCHASNCDFAGILADQGDICLVKGGIIQSCRDGVVLNATKGTVGYQGSSLGNSTQIKSCTEFGLYWSRGAQGHCDYVLFDQNNRALRVESAARVHVLGTDFRRSTVAAISTNTDGSYYDDVSTVNAFNDGTGNANTKRYEHNAYTQQQQGWADSSYSEMRLYFSQSSTNHTGTLAKTQIITLTLPTAGGVIPAYWFQGAEKRIRIRLRGQLPNRAGTAVGVDFVNGATNKEMDLSTVVGTGNGQFLYDCVIDYNTLTSQRSHAELNFSTGAPRIQTSSCTADMALAQTIKITAQLANVADTITITRVEVWVEG